MANRNTVDILIRARDEASKALGKVRGEMVGLQGSSRQTAQHFQSLVGPSSIALGAITALGGAAVAAAGGMVTLAGKLEQSEIAFTTLLDSGEAAQEFLTDLADFAASTPFDFVGLQNSSRLLLAFGFEAEAVLPIVGALGDATSALGGNTDTLEGVVRALGQIETKGKVSTEELLQLAERGIPVFEILREKLELTNEEVANIGSLGISSSEAITAILEGLSERFGGAMQAQSESLLGLWSNVTDTVQLAAMDIGTALIDALDLKAHLQTAIEWLDRLREKVAEIDIRQLFADNKEAIELFAGALIGMATPAMINLGLATLRAVRPLAGLAIAGALVVGVAQELGLDFDKLAAPKGALARTGMIVAGLTEIFQGITISIANLIKATGQSLGDWALFLSDVFGQIGELFTHVSELATKSQEVQDALRNFQPAKALEAFRELRDLAAERPTINIGEAYNQAFKGLDAEILDGFDRAHTLVTSGTQKIIDGFVGEVDAGATQTANAITEMVTTTAQDLIDWAQLLGGSPTDGLEEITTAAEGAKKATDELADSSSTAKRSWTEIIEGIGASSGTWLQSALGLDQPDNEFVAAGKQVVAGFIRGFAEAFPDFAVRVDAAMGVMAANAADHAAAAAYDAYIKSGGPLVEPPSPTGAPIPSDPLMPGLLGPGGRPNPTNRPLLQIELEPIEVNITLDQLDLDTITVTDPRLAPRPRPLPPAQPSTPVPELPSATPDLLGDPSIPAPRGLGRDFIPVPITPPVTAGVTPAVSDEPPSVVKDPAELLAEEMAAREEVIAGLTTMSTENGPIANLGNAMLNLAANSVPAFGAALDGFVQAGPVGAIIGFLTELLSQSEGFQQLIAAINAALEPLAEALGQVLLALMPMITPLLELFQVTAAIAKLIGQVLAPAFNLIGMVIGGVVDALIAAWNFLLGWIPGLRIEPIPTDPPDDDEAQAPWHSDQSPTGEMNFARVGQGVQLAISTPLVEAANLSFSAASTLASAAATFTGAAETFTAAVDRFAEGIRIELDYPDQTGSSQTAYLR